MKNLLNDGVFQKVLNGAAAGQGTSNSDEVDMAGFDSLAFIVSIGAITATGTVTIHAEQDVVTGMGTAADLAGSAQAYTDADSNKLLILEIERPLERFVRCVCVRATANAVINGIYAIKRMAKNRPVTQGATVVASKILLSPAEGTP
jgi:hypothetical protein